MRNDDLALIVLSCDKYSSLWPLFFKRLDKNFPRSMVKVYLLSNHIDLGVESHHDVEVICVGKDISWSANLRKALTGIHEPNVFLLMDDGPLARAVEVEDFQRSYGYFIENEMNYLNLKASPAPNSNEGKCFGDILPSKAYRTALVPSFWRKSVLTDLLKDDENAWQFEVYGSERSKKYQGFYSLNKPLFTFDHIVIKGKIERGVFKKLKRNNEHIGIDFPVMNSWEYLKEQLSGVRSKLIKRFLPDNILGLLRKKKYGG